MLLLGCASEHKDGAPLSAEEQALLRATELYTALYMGDVERFLHGRVASDSYDDEYSRQLLDNYRRHVGSVNTDYGGVARVEASRAEPDIVLGVMQAFLVLTYGNGVREEIVVPMVEDGGRWKMK